MVSPRSRSASSSSESSSTDTVQLFIKPISGGTITLTVPSTITTEKLTTLLSIRTRLPASDLRLVHAGHHLSSGDILSSRGIKNESTLHLATPLRGGMPPKKIRCGAIDSGIRCSEGVSRIVGECGFCGGCFCGKHRLLEDHKCKGLEDVSVHPAFIGFASPSVSLAGTPSGTPGDDIKGKGKDEEGYFVVEAVRQDEAIDAAERLVKLEKQQREREKLEITEKVASSELSKEELRELDRLSDGKEMKEELGRLAGVQEGEPRAERKYAK